VSISEEEVEVAKVPSPLYMAVIGKVFNARLLGL
jgi:hypothetical protein